MAKGTGVRAEGGLGQVLGEHEPEPEARRELPEHGVGPTALFDLRLADQAAVEDRAALVLPALCEGAVDARQRARVGVSVGGGHHRAAPCPAVHSGDIEHGVAEGLGGHALGPVAELFLEQVGNAGRRRPRDLEVGGAAIFAGRKSDKEVDVERPGKLLANESPEIAPVEASHQLVGEPAVGHRVVAVLCSGLPPRSLRRHRGGETG